jgi:hypothetical protein
MSNKVEEVAAFCGSHAVASPLDYITAVSVVSWIRKVHGTISRDRAHNQLEVPPRPNPGAEQQRKEEHLGKVGEGPIAILGESLEESSITNGSRVKVFQ